MTPPITVRQALVGDLDTLAPLFDAYRQFYRQPGDIDAARAFLRQRFEHGQSVLFLAERGEAAVGLCQLYPGFSSISLRRTLLLNDLYVDPAARRLGVAAALIDASTAYAAAIGAASLSLMTARDNLPAQTLYAAKGWLQDEEFLTYEFTL